MKAMIKLCTWLLLTAMFTCAVVEAKNDNSLHYKTVIFNMKATNKESYSQFLQAVRGRLLSGNQIHGIPVLPHISDSHHFLLLSLSNSITQEPITLAMDINNANIVAFSVKNQSYFFSNSVSFSDLFTNTQQNRLPFGSSYDDLENVAGKKRSKIELGLIALDEDICRISTQNTNSNKDLASFLIVVMQMVSEAARFRRIEQQVRWSSQNNQTFRPDNSILWLENNWEVLSAAIQESNNGIFSTPILIQRSNRRTFNLHGVTRELVANLAFIISFNHGGGANNFEPMVRIIGRDGLCVDAKDDKFHDGNPVHMWPCKPKPAANQLWTFKKDGTIQSNGKCLTAANVHNPEGKNVTINDCQTAMPNATGWAIWDNGTLINPQLGLVLSAKSGGPGTVLTLEKNSYASSQGFVPSNNTKPFVSSIVGFSDLCLEANGTNVWVAECACASNSDQQWALFADGSIRPKNRQNECLTSGTRRNKGAILRIDSCDLALPGHRWWFTSNGIIFNLHSGMVMDVEKNDPSLKHIILWTPHGRPNQKWLPLF